MVIAAATSTAPAAATSYPTFDDSPPGRPVEGGPYRVGFARNAAQLDEILTAAPLRVWPRIIQRAAGFVAVVAAGSLLLFLGRLLLSPLPQLRRRFTARLFR